VIGLVVETHCKDFAPLAFLQDVESGLRVAHVGSASVRYEVGLFASGQRILAGSQSGPISQALIHICAKPIRVHLQSFLVESRPIGLGHLAVCGCQLCQPRKIHFFHPGTQILEYLRGPIHCCHLLGIRNFKVLPGCQRYTPAPDTLIKMFKVILHRNIG